MVTEGLRGKGALDLKGKWTEYCGPPRPLHLLDGRIVMTFPGDWLLVRRVSGSLVCLWHKRRSLN